MGMSIDRALKLRNEAVSAWRSLDSRARICGMSHESILEHSAKINASIAKVPGWARGYVNGYAQRLRDSWYESGALVWAHVAPDGTRYTADKNPPAWAQSVDPLYKAGRGADIATWNNGYFWRDSGKLFSAGAPALPNKES